MSDTETTTDETTTTPEDGEGGSQEQPDGDTGGSKLHREAARYRTQLRETEAERDALKEQIHSLQTREAERLASHGLSNPADLFALGSVELADLLNEDGGVDPDRVSEVVSEILGSRPGLRPDSPAVDYTQGHGNKTMNPKPSWSQLFR